MLNFRGAFMGMQLSASKTAPAVLSPVQPDPAAFSIQTVVQAPLDAKQGPAPWSRPYVHPPYPRAAFIAGRGVGVGPAPNIPTVSLSDDSC